MHFHPKASHDKYNTINHKSTKKHKDASHPYVPLPVFAGGKWLLGVGAVPRFAVFRRKLPTFADCCKNAV
jgi:hypothetical protein